MTGFLVDEIKECKKEIKEIREFLKINPHFSEGTVAAYQVDIKKLEKIINSYQKSLDQE